MYEESYYLVSIGWGDSRKVLLVARYSADDFLIEYSQRNSALPFIHNILNIEESTFEEMINSVPRSCLYDNR